MKYRFRRRLIYTLLLLADNLFLLIPYNLALAIGKVFGAASYFILARYRRLAKKQLRVAFKDTKDSREISRIARGVFINLGIGLAEVLSLPKIRGRLDKIIDVKGLEKIDGVLKEGRGAIVVSGHIGNWELLPMYFACRGYPANVVARPLYYDKYNEWVLFLRGNMGVNVLMRSDSPKRFISLLRQNELVGILPDQDIDSIEGVFVDFFGRKAYTPSAPAKLALAAGCPIIPVFIIRNNKRHTIYVEDPIRIDSAGQNKEDAVFLCTQRWSSVVESYISRYPQQWVWMHKRWKTQPPHG